MCVLGTSKRASETECLCHNGSMLSLSLTHGRLKNKIS